MEGLNGDAERGRARSLPSVGVSVKQREIGARDFDPQRVAWKKGRCERDPGVDPDSVRFVWSSGNAALSSISELHPLKTHCQILSIAVRPDVD